MPYPSHFLSRRSLLQHTAFAALSIPLASMATSCATTTANSEPNPEALTIGYVPISCATPLLIAHAQGLFKSQGLNVELRKYSGWADLWSAYSTGGLDIAHMLSPMPVVINAGATNGQRATELAFTQNTNGQAITLATKHLAHVRSAADFRGMIIGIPFDFSVHALLFRDFLAAGGVDPVRDLELRLLRPSDMIAQLQVGGIDGFVGPEPFNQRAIASGAGRIFKLTKELWPGHPCCSIAMAKDWRAAHEQQAQGIITALTAASTFANDPANQHEVADTLAQEQYLNQPAALILPTLSGEYENWDGQTITDHQRMSFGDPTDPAAITWMATQIARWNLGGNALTMDDSTLIRLADSVLPTAAHQVATSQGPVVVNGREFDPNIPTAGYEESP